MPEIQPVQHQPVWTVRFGYQASRAEASSDVGTNGHLTAGRACPLCPCISDINLFRYCKCVIDLDAEIPDCAFDLGVTEQELDSSEVARPSIN